MLSNLKLDGNLKWLFHYIVHFERIIFLIFKNQSIYFDEPNPAQAEGSSPDGLPDWVVGELGTSEHRCSESRELSPGEDYSLVQSPTDVHRYAWAWDSTCVSSFSLSLELVNTFHISLFFMVNSWFTLCLLKLRAMKECHVGKISVAFPMMVYWRLYYILKWFLNIC